MRKYWSILLTDQRLASCLPKEPALRARRAPNLRDRLTCSHFVCKHPRLSRGSCLWGMYPCGSCNICPFRTQTSTFVNPSSGDQFQLQHYINCKKQNGSKWFNMFLFLKCMTDRQRKNYICPPFPWQRETQDVERRSHQWRSTF